MGKKNKDEAPKPNNVLNRDILQRLNFLYQASVCMESISRQCNRGPTLDLEGSSEDNSERTTTTPLPKASGRKRPQEQCKGRVIRASDIGQGYVRAMRLIGQKATVKMDPTVKRTLCKGCDTVLIPGQSATVRINSSNNHRHLITTSCLRCQLSRRIPAPPVPKLAPVPHNDIAMDIDKSGDSAAPKSKRRRGPPPRPPPLFEREGHVIFRGNEQINVKKL
ncbi:RNAse P Rpr2/Rpp21/SNM1 subunit domain-containing protein [Lactifluus volemus]|nr:RNAse P Rpr2/Rpp21/SNM1 subunit domain-containing protein [Lactifluus volemus]